MDYNVTVELDSHDIEGTADAVYAAPQYSPAVHAAPGGRAAVTLTIPYAGPDPLADVASEAIVYLNRLGYREFAVTVLPTDEFDRRADGDGGDWLSVPEAATELGISQQRVRQLLDEGKLLGQKIGRDWNVSPQSVQDRLAALGK